ncbi:MAG: hypothetical protein F4X27_06015 [Chloroflexi bacterium]|nr:hypothetical protein [Chloroflexota bacterium]
MPTIHFLNVKEGDCSVIQHGSGRVSVIDVCNAKPSYTEVSKSEMALATMATRAVQGNFNQKAYPVNPVAYLEEHGIGSVFRFILTHPDMDHMDGIKAFFDRFSPENFWDTNNKKEMDNSSWSASPYNRSDWDFYKLLRDTKPSNNPKRLANLSGQNGQYWNRGEDGNTGGDGLAILAPTQKLVNDANEKDDYNDCSYVLLYRTGDKRIVFGGDSHDDTWEHILSNWEQDVRDIDLLIAPHHGRDSGRSYDFLDVLKPTLTFFGNARSEYLAYDAWYRRNLDIITNNQANCMVVNSSGGRLDVYVTNETFAKRYNPGTFYDGRFRAWYICSI